MNEVLRAPMWPLRGLSCARNSGIALLALALSVILLFANLGCSASAPVAQKPAEKFSVRIADRAFISYLPLHIAQDEGYFAAENVDVSFSMFNTSAEGVVAMVAGETDLVSPGDESSLNLILRGADLKSVFAQSVAKADGKSQAIVVRKDLYDKGLRDPKDLKGKNLAWVSGWSPLPYAAQKSLERYGVDVAKDVNIQQIRENPAKVAALEKGAIDAAMFTEPWVTIATARGLAVPIAYVQVPEGIPFGMIGFNGDYIKKNRDGILRLLKAYIKGVDTYIKVQQDPAQKRKYAEKYAKQYGLEVDDMVNMTWSEMSADGRFNEQSIQDWMDWVAANGGVNGKVKLDQWWDPSFLDELKKQGVIK